MKKKKFLTFGIITFLVLVGIFSAYFVVADLSKGESEKFVVTYTPTTDTICQDGTCTTTLWSGIRNAYEDDKWKRVENARSLKGSGIECVVDSDGENLVECLDWNMTYIKLRLSQKTGSLIDKEVPIRIYERNESGDLVLNSETKETFSSLSNEKDKELLDFEYGDIIHFGDKSTIIMLQDNETENLEDTYVRDSQPLTSYGSETLLRVYDGAYELIIFIKFNISSIPGGHNITDAQLYLYADGFDPAEGEEHNLYNLSDQTWTETITWSTKPDVDGILQSSRNDINDQHVWYNFTVINAVKSDYESENSNTSFMINNTNNPSYFASKEESTISIRPYLNITYTEVAASSHLFLLDKHFILKNKHFILKGE